MARKFARSTGRTGGHGRRLTDWTSTAPEGGWSGLSASTAVIDSSFTTVSGDPETIIRSVGQFAVQTDQIAASEEPFGAVGLCVVSDEAFAIGVTAVPTPYVDADSDLWLFHQFWATGVFFGDGTGFASLLQRYTLESKAMRRISGDQVLILVVENASVLHGCEYRLDMRLLTKVA